MVAKFADGTPAAYGHEYGKGVRFCWGLLRASRTKRIPRRCIRSGDILAKWAGLDPSQPEGTSASGIAGDEWSLAAQFVFLFNHGETGREVEFAETLGAAGGKVREIVTGETRKAEGKDLW